MAENHLGFLMFYFFLFGAVAIFGYYGSDDLGLAGDLPTVPTLAGDDLTLLNSLFFVFDVVVFFFFLQGLTIFGLPVIYSTILSIALNIGLFYVLARLVRGGG